MALGARSEDAKFCVPNGMKIYPPNRTAFYHPFKPQSNRRTVYQCACLISVYGPEAPRALSGVSVG